MTLNSYFNQYKEKVIECTQHYLDLDVRDVPTFYVDNIQFYKCIKNNYQLSSESYNDMELIKERYKLLCEMIQGLYKWKEKKIYIKKEVKYDFSLLLAELLHSKSITQGKNWIRKWISEGLIHSLAKILCNKCDIMYIESGHSDYFVIWERIHERYNLEVLKTILFSQDLRISIEILKHIFRYEKDDILEITFKKAKTMIKNK